MSASPKSPPEDSSPSAAAFVDLYSWQAPLPLRLEFFGDQIESLREFDIDTQTSVRDLGSVDILLGAPVGPDRLSLIDQSGRVRDYVAPNDLIIDLEPEMEGGAPATPGSRELATPHIQISEGWIETGPEDFGGAFQDCEIGEFAVGDLRARRGETGAVCRAFKRMARRQRKNRHLFSD